MSEAIVTVTGELVELGMWTVRVEIDDATYITVAGLTDEQVRALAPLLFQRVTVEIRRARE